MNIEDVFYSILTKKPIISKLQGSTDNDLFESYQALNLNNQEFLVVMEELLLNTREHGKKDIRKASFLQERH